LFRPSPPAAMFSATRAARPGTLRRVGQQMRNAHAHAEHTPEEKAMFNQMVFEATILGGIMAFWWRSSHMAQKVRCFPLLHSSAPCPPSGAMFCGTRSAWRVDIDVQCLFGRRCSLRP